MTDQHNRQGRGERGHSPRRVRSAQRDAEAVKLRAAGLTEQEIAERLGFSDRSGAHRAIKRGLDSFRRQTADEAVDLMRTRIELQIRGWFALSAARQDPQAARVVLGLLREMARLEGTDHTDRTRQPATDNNDVDGWLAHMIGPTDEYMLGAADGAATVKEEVE